MPRYVGNRTTGNQPRLSKVSMLAGRKPQSEARCRVKPRKPNISLGGRSRLIYAAFCCRTWERGKALIDRLAAPMRCTLVHWIDRQLGLPPESCR